MFRPPAASAVIIDALCKIGIESQELFDFYSISNGWPFKYGRRGISQFLSIHALTTMAEKLPTEASLLEGLLESIDIGFSVASSVVLTENNQGSELIIYSPVDRCYMVDPFLGELEPRGSFSEILIACRDVYLADIRESL